MSKGDNLINPHQTRFSYFYDSIKTQNVARAVTNVQCCFFNSDSEGDDGRTREGTAPLCWYSLSLTQLSVSVYSLFMRVFVDSDSESLVN